MNFLNKKYTNRHSSSQYSNSNTFLPASSSVREINNHIISQSNCQIHQNEIIRNFCVECVQLLCAQCIGQHLQMHREANVIPKIYSIKQMRAQMQAKIDYIDNFMHLSSPQKIELDAVKKRALQKIDQMRKDLFRAVDQWINIMRGHLLASIGFDEMAKMKTEMQKLSEQIIMLKSAMINNNQASIVKKIFQIDGQRLQQGYVGMFKKYKQLIKKSDFQFSISWKQIIKSLQANIIIKGKQEVIIEDEQSDAYEGNAEQKQAIRAMQLNQQIKSKAYQYR